MKAKYFSHLILALAAALAVMLVFTPSPRASAQTPPPTPTPAVLPDPLSNGEIIDKVIPQSTWRPALYPAPYAATPHDHFYFTRPVGVDEVNWPLSSYRYGGSFFAPDQPHTGVDITAPEGTPVLAAASGQIVWAGTGLLFGDNDEDDPYGIAIAIEHNFGWDNQTLYTLYAHLSEVKVRKGDYVEVGQVIALSGDTGFTTGPHLHFEVRIGTNNYFQTLNPELWLTPPQGYGVLVGRMTDGVGEPLITQDVILTNEVTGQEFRSQSYSSIFTINGDPFYGENFAVSDLPAGRYKIQIPYYGYMYQNFVEVYPGRISYFRYRGLMGFSDFQPSADIPTSIEGFVKDN
jgi:hypothetical protein